MARKSKAVFKNRVFPLKDNQELRPNTEYTQAEVLNWVQVKGGFTMDDVTDLGHNRFMFEIHKPESGKKIRMTIYKIEMFDVITKRDINKELYEHKKKLGLV